MNESKDDPRDAHLLAALRHAPDRDATPPREVSERILAAARAAAASTRVAVPPAREARAPWWQRLSAWLTQPQVAASFGTLIVASLVGVMWSTREPPVAEFTPSSPAAADRVEPPSAAEAPVAAPPAKVMEPDANAVATAPAAPARPEAAAAPRPKRAAAQDAAARDPLRSRTAAESAAASAGSKATPSAMLPPPPAAETPAPPAAEATAPVASAASAERRSAPANDLLALERRREAAPRADSAAAVGMALSGKANAAADPLARWGAVLGVEAPDNVRWRIRDRRDELATAHGAAQVLWWSALRRATAGQWQTQARTPSPRPTWLAFDLSGSPAGSIDLVGDAVIFCPADAGTCWRAPITPAQREAWTAVVAHW